MVMLQYRLQSWPLMRTLLWPLPLPAGCHICVPARNLIISTTAAFRMNATSGPAMPPRHPAAPLPPAIILVTKEKSGRSYFHHGKAEFIVCVCVWVWGVLSHQEGVEEVPSRRTNGRLPSTPAFHEEVVVIVPLGILLKRGDVGTVSSEGHCAGGKAFRTRSW